MKGERALEKPSDRRVVISVGVGKRYEPYVRRLHRTVDQFWSGPTMFYDGRYPEGSPTHEEVNYGFKAYAVREAVARGYTCLLYCDSCVVARSPLEPLFDHIQKVGYVLIGDSHRVRDWTSDAALRWTGFRRSDIPPDRTSAAGGFVGMDLLHSTGKLLCDSWLDAVEKKLTGVLWANGPIGDRASSCSFHTGEFIAEDPTVQGHMGDEAILGLLMLKYGLRAEHGSNPWCSQFENGVFLSTGYDDGKYGALDR